MQAMPTSDPALNERLVFSGQMSRYAPKSIQVNQAT